MKCILEKEGLVKKEVGKTDSCKGDDERNAVN